MKKSKISKKLENLGFNKTLFINSIALLMAWLMILLPVYTAEAFEITFNQNTAQVTPNTAWIAWTTDEAASSGIVYGLMSPPNKQQSEPGQRFDHSMNLTNLQSDKTYYYWLFGVSESGENATNKNNGEYYQFKTLPPPDGEPPKQVDLEATSITKTEITLTWEPNVDDKDIAKYNVYKTNELIGDGIVVKTFTDVNLTSGVEYSYEVAAVDITGNEGEKSAIKVKTLDQYSQEIIISELKADVTGVNVLLTWNTNNHTSAEVKYGPSDSTPSNTATKSDMSLIHNVTLSNLQPNKEYAAIVQSCDSHTNCGIENISFTTSEKIELKLEITNKLFDNDPNTILFHNSNEMDIVGESTPGAEVDIYVDGKAKRFSKVGSNGLFSFKKVGLTPGAKQTEVKITATDKVNLVEFIEKVQLDLDAPNVQLDNISTFSGEANLEIKGNLTDDTFPIKVLIQKIIPDDSTPPAQVVNMSELEASDNSIQLSWSAPADYDLQKFIVYRNNVFDVGGLAPIATVEKGTTKYTDSKVSSNTEYEYAVSALDTAGNEGQKSDSITVLTLNGTASKDPIVQLKPEDIRSELTTTQEITKSGKFSVSVALNEGKNDLQIMFVDDAGNKYEYQISVMHDSTPPNILTPTSEEILSRFSPSYTSEIPFTGQVDSNATVKIWINPGLGNKTPSYEIQTDESGIFSVDLTLSRDKGIGSNSVDTAITSTNFQLGGDDGSENVIRVIAVDAAGQESEPVESTILYTSCGSGYFFNPDIKKVGAILNSREIIEGIAATGFEYVLSWVGGSKGARITNIRVEPAKLSEHDLIKYDPINEWLTIVNPPYHPMNNWSYGSVLLNFKQPLIEGNTTFEKEKNISNHRRDECMPGFGCFKFKLMMTIDFQRNDAMIPQQTAGGETWMEPTTQKTCIDFNVLVDERIDPSILPQNFLKATVDFLDTAIDALEGIQEPIKKITQIVWAICLVSMLAKLVMNMKKEYVCKFQSAISSDVIKSTIKSVLGVGMTVEDVASYGGCEYEFKSKDQGTYDVCMECSEAIKKKWKIDKLFTMTCDRIFCPAVITMQHFIKENRIAPGSYSYSKIQGLVSNPVASETGTAPAEAEESQPKTVDLSNHKKFYTYQDVVDSQGGKLNKVAKTLKDAKTDCAFANPTRSTIKELFYLFEYGENEKDDHVQFFSFDSLPDGKTLKQACEEPHPPQAACCPFDYNRIWQWGAVFVNEVKQSYCMTDRKADECSFGNSLLESVAGLCEPDKKTNTYAEIPQDLAWYKSTQFNFGGVMAGKPKVYYKIEYDDSGRLTGVHRGFIVQDTVLEANDAKKEAEKNALLSKVNSDDVVEIQNQNRFIYANRASNLVEAFDVLDPSNVENEEEVDMDAAIDKFYQDLKYEPQPVTTYGVTKMGEVDSVVGKSSTVGEKPIVSFVQSSKGVSGSNKYIERLYEEVAGITGSTDDKYIADPRNSFIQSLFTLCLRAIVAWIQHLINFMLMLKQCFETIMLTGDGSAGVCQNLISQYICDLFYELISCLVKSVGGHGQEQGIGGIGGIFAAMQTGSQSVTDDVAGRYGESNFFSQQLTAQNLVHDLCIWAFTGEWPTDWSSILDISTTMPINSSVLIFNPTRRFNGIGTDENGVFNYRFSYWISAGADIQYTVMLVCSGDKTGCDTEDGVCDCGRIATIPPQDSGLLSNVKKSGNCPENMQLKTGKSCNEEILLRLEQPLRYDKVKISWEPLSQDLQPSAEQGSGMSFGSFAMDNMDPEALKGSDTADITEMGGTPSYCGFDITALKFRCGYGRPDIGAIKIMPTIEPARGAGRPAYLGDTDLFKMQVLQKIPKDKRESCIDGSCEHVKYLIVEQITNKATNNKVWPPSGLSTKELPYFKLDTNTVHDVLFSTLFTDISTVPFEVKKEFFSPYAAQAVGVSGKGICEYKTNVQGANKGSFKDEYLDTMPGQTGKVVCSSSGPAYAVKIIAKNIGGMKFFYQMGTLSQNNKNKFEPIKNAQEKECETLEPRKMECGENGEITFKHTELLDQYYAEQETKNAKNMPELEFVAAYTSTGEYENANLDPYCTAEEIDFEVLVGVYNGEDNGGWFTKSSNLFIDENGEKIQEKIPVKIVCREGGNNDFFSNQGVWINIGSQKLVLNYTHDATNPNKGMWLHNADMMDSVLVGPVTKKLPNVQVTMKTMQGSPVVYLDMGLAKKQFIQGYSKLMFKPDGSSESQLKEVPLGCEGELPCIFDVQNEGLILGLQIAPAGEYIFEKLGDKTAGDICGVMNSIGYACTGPAIVTTGVQINYGLDLLNIDKLTLGQYAEKNDGFTINGNVDTAAPLANVKIYLHNVKGGLSSNSAEVSIGTVKWNICEDDTKTNCYTTGSENFDGKDGYYIELVFGSDNIGKDQQWVFSKLYKATESTGSIAMVGKGPVTINNQNDEQLEKQYGLEIFKNIHSQDQTYAEFIFQNFDMDDTSFEIEMKATVTKEYFKKYTDIKMKNLHAQFGDDVAYGMLFDATHAEVSIDGNEIAWCKTIPISGTAPCYYNESSSSVVIRIFEAMSDFKKIKVHNLTKMGAGVIVKKIPDYANGDIVLSKNKNEEYGLVLLDKDNHLTGLGYGVLTISNYKRQSNGFSMSIDTTSLQGTQPIQIKIPVARMGYDLQTKANVTGIPKCNAQKSVIPCWAEEGKV